MNGDIIVLSFDNGYEGLYVDDELTSEGNPINEGTERILYFIHLAKKYEFKIEDIKFGYISDKDLSYYDDLPLDLTDEIKSKIVWQTL